MSCGLSKCCKLGAEAGDYPGAGYSPNPSTLRTPLEVQAMPRNMFMACCPGDQVVFLIFLFFAVSKG